MHNLLDSIKFMIESALNNASFDKTRSAIVVSESRDGKCKVRLDGYIYELPIYAKDTVFIGTGEIVKVIIPCNNMNKAWILPRMG